MIEHEIESIKSRIDHMNKLLATAIDELKAKDSKLDDLRSHGLWVDAACIPSFTGIQITNTTGDESFYHGNIAIGRSIKKPGKIISDLIESLAIGDKEKFLTEIKPILKKYLKVEQDWEDLNLAFAKVIEL